MNDILLYGPVAIYLLALFIIASKVIMNNEALTAEQFLKGKSNYTWVVLTITLVATFIGPGFSVGAVDSVSSMGWTFGLAVACTPIHMIITGVFLSKSERAQKITSYRTAGALLEDTFGQISRPILGIGLVVLYIFFAAQLITGSIVILEVVFGLSGEAIAILIAIIVATYSLSCGISGVIKTDILQFIFLAILLVFFIFIGLSIGELKISPSIQNQQPQDITFNFPLFLGIALTFLLGDAFQPLYMQRAFFGKSSKQAGKAFIIGGTLAIVWFLTITWVGLSIADKNISFTNDQGRIIEVLNLISGNNELLYFLILGIIGAGFIGLIMSTLDSVLNTASGTLIDDFVGYFIQIDEDKKIVLMKLSIAALSIIGAVIASFNSNMIELMLQAYEIWIPTVLAMVIISFFRVGCITNIPKSVPIIGITTGIAIWSVSLWIPDPVVPWSVWGFLANFSILISGISFLNKPE
ncbi:MAG: hypothetical protein HWD84_11130 [Flavobacteriaceae bacterium]|nr:hypothetical protein [Flavobacteriaceae bacterium]